MDKKRIETGAAPPALGPYSQAISVRASGLVFVSGQIPLNPAGEIEGETAAEQAETCLRNIAAILETAGAGMDSVVKVTVFLKTMADFGAVNEVYAKFFGAPYPARACIGGLELPKDVLVKIEAVAAV
ncbi:MAG: Rid family detoxifying hydrolase [bacterium]